MSVKKFAGVFAAAIVVLGLGVAPASATDEQAFGLQQTVNDPSGGEIGYTVTKLLPSTDAVPYPVAGQLYEVTVRADALNGMPIPVIGGFSAQTASGQSYPALAGVWTPQGLSGATLLPGSHSTGKIYFDAVGEAPTKIVYTGGGETLIWAEPAAAPPAETAAETAAPEAGGSAGEKPSAPAESGGTDKGAANSVGNGDAAAADEDSGS